ncbi:GA-like domain-containing protein [Staphylococcus pseudoxylosus]|uniref:GA-like domain-containing protein n=1 Tax=Staphylococcus pseudoxylosus TaxID=2282419 RepID=UPI00390663F5
MRVLAEYIARRNNKYSIRKFTIGTASVLLGTVLFMNQDSEAEADMVNDQGTLGVQNKLAEQGNSETKQDNLEKFAEKEPNIEKQELLESKEINNNTQNEQKNLNNEPNAEEVQNQNEILNKDKIEETTKHNIEEKPQLNKDESQPKNITQASHDSLSQQNSDDNELISSEDNSTIKTQKEKNKNTITENNVEKQSPVNDEAQNNTSKDSPKTDNVSDNQENISLNAKDSINKEIDEETSKPKKRVTRSLNSAYYNNLRSRRYGPRISYNIVQSGDYITNVLREVERNRDELTAEERKLFLRNIIRQTSLKNNRSAYDSIFNGDYSVARNRKISSSQADKINQLLYKMRDLVSNRENEDYRATYTFTNQSDVTKNKFGIVKDNILYDDEDILIATIVLSKEKGRGTYRFENYGIRPNESLNKKIKQVYAVYEGGPRVLLRQDRLGYYSYTRPNSGNNGNPNRGGGSGGTVKFIISFDANYYIDVKEDKLFGYILSDTLDPNVLRGVNITNQSVDINDVARRINTALVTSKKQKAEEAIVNAEQANQYAKKQIAEVTADGAVSPSEKQKVDEAINALEEAKKIAIAKLDGVLNGTAGKDNLQRRIDQISTIISPEVNDLDSNGVADTIQLAEAVQAVKSAEDAKQILDQKIAEAVNDGLINPNEQAMINQLNQAFKEAKNEAIKKVNNVPDGIEDKKGLQNKLDQMNEVTIPEINDLDSNGVADTEQLAQAQQAIEAAEQAKTAAANKLAEITADGLVNPSERAELDKLIETLKAAKTTASDKLNNVPDGTAGKDELQRRLDQIDSVTLPEVNDQDGNGVLDTEQLSDAKKAIEAAEQAKSAVDNKLAESTADGLVNPSEKADLDKLIEALEAAKTNASDRLNNVPNGTTGKAELQSRLDQIGSVTAPEVTDKDSNGVADTEQLAQAQRAIEAAEQAKSAVDNKLAEITGDGLVNPSERAELDKLIETLEAAKTNASEKLNNVPDGTTGKDGLQTRLDQIGTVTSPEVNDQDGNGVLDTEQLTDAEQAIEAVEEAKQAVDNKLSEITADDLINPTEKAELDRLIETLETAKTNATEKLNNVPDGTAGKVDLQTRLDGIGTVTAPEVTDKDSNGIADTAQLSEAQQAIEVAEQAKTAVADKLAEITGDGLVNPSEKADLDKLIEALEEAKTNASDKLNNVPNGTAGKVDLQTRLDGIGTVTSPEVNDLDSNGVADAEQLSEARRAIEAAEQAKTAADNKLAEVTADGLVNPSEKADLDKLIETLEAAKTNASEKLNNVPNGTTGKDVLQTRLDQVDSVTAPEINDQDGNGVLDTEQLTDAEQAIASVEQAKQAVENKLAEITADGLVNPSEKAELDKLIETLEEAKTNASDKLNNVPKGTADKDELQTRLDQIGTVTSPEVNDLDSNGVLDAEQLSEAQQAIEAAEEAKSAVDNKLSEITADGLVNPSEKAELDKLIETLEEAKTNASEKLDNVPNGTTGKDGLQTRLDQVDSVTAPEINDQDGNGVADTEQLSEAQRAIEAAEQAKQAVDNKLAEITADGLVNPSEKADLDRLIEALDEAKVDATAKLNSVPVRTPGKSDIQTRLDGIGTVTTPEVNDQDSNGVLDAEQLAEANKVIQAVEQAKAKVEGKLTEIKKDGLITPSEKTEVDKLIEALQKSKVSALNIIKKLPNSDIDINSLQNKLEQITLVTSPKVNDQDGNGILDIESPNTKGQNHANINKHLDNTIRKSKSQKPMNNNVKIQNSNERDNMLLDEISHTGLYRHNSEARQLNVVSSYIQIMENEANGNSENNMNSITHLPDTGGKNKDSWIFGTLLGAIGSMMLLRKKQEKRKEQKK